MAKSRLVLSQKNYNIIIILLNNYIKPTKKVTRKFVMPFLFHNMKWHENINFCTFSCYEIYETKRQENLNFCYFCAFLLYKIDPTIFLKNKLYDKNGFATRIFAQYSCF